MDIGMTIHATSAVIPVARVVAVESGGFIPGPGTGMPPHMTVLAQGGCPLDEKFLVATAVGRMTNSAVFFHRGMFPHIRPALVGVAGVAKIIQGVGRKHSIAHGAVGIVAVGAGHFAFVDGMA